MLACATFTVALVSALTWWLAASASLVRSLEQVRSLEHRQTYLITLARYTGDTEALTQARTAQQEINHALKSASQASPLAAQALAVSSIARSYESLQTIEIDLLTAIAKKQGKRVATLFQEWRQQRVAFHALLEESVTAFSRQADIQTLRLSPREDIRILVALAGLTLALLLLAAWAISLLARARELTCVSRKAALPASASAPPSMSAPLAMPQRLKESPVREPERSSNSDSHLFGIIEGTTDAIAAIDKDYRLTAFNRSFASQCMRLYGKRLAVSMSIIDDVLPNDADTKKKAQSLWSRALMGEEFTEQEEQSDTVGTHWYEHSYSPIRDKKSAPVGAVLIVRDITDRKQAEANLLQAKEQIEREASNARKFELAVERSTDAIIITDRAGTIIYCNPSLTSLISRKPTDVLNRSVLTLLHASAESTASASITQSLEASATFHTEDILIGREKGQAFAAEFTLYPIVREGKLPEFFVGIIHDISQRKQLERAQSEFVSLASHQLRTPLTAIRLALGALGRGEVGLMPTESAEILTRAIEYGGHMAQTIDTMLNISRLESGKLTAQRKETPLKPILEEIISEQGLEQKRRKQMLTLDCPTDITLLSDRSLLKEAIGNLVSNAIKYTPDGGTVTVSAGIRDERAEIRVSDTGYGIPDDAQEKIFSKFYRADNVKAFETSGTGLGLYLVRSIAAMLGGTVSFTSRQNVGTTFLLSIPLSPP
mgnify:CR=1 FL=1